MRPPTLPSLAREPSPLVLLGGTFDPPHLGHLVLGECARVQFRAHETLFFPAGDPWRKSGSAPGPPPLAARAITPAAHRLAMTRLAVAGNDGFRVDDREVLRAGPSYTVDTLEELHGEGCRELILVVGTDALADMRNWNRPGRIRELATLAVAAKPGAGDVQLEPGVELVEMPSLAISSTEIRERVAAGRPIRYLVPRAVEAYIAEHGLYRP